MGAARKLQGEIDRCGLPKAQQSVLLSWVLAHNDFTALHEPACSSCRRTDRKAAPTTPCLQ